LILVLDGLQLADARTLRECGVEAGTQLTLVMRLRGGVGMDAASDVDPFEDLDDSGEDGLSSSGPPEVSGK
jgi:hypothetical protein